MTAKYNWEIDALAFIILGGIHLFYSFENKFTYKNDKVITEMKSSNPILTDETSLWHE